MDRGREPRDREAPARRSVHADPPPRPSPAPFDRTSGPQLTARTIVQFLDWAARVPHSATDVIRERIAAASQNDELLGGLAAELRQRPFRDLGRSLLLLSLVGELRDERLLAPLRSLIWEEEPLMEAGDPRPSSEQGDQTTFLMNPNAALQSRAVEMQAYLGTRDAEEETLEVAARHPSDAVRIAAIDAYLYNHGDSDDAMARLRAAVRPGDAKFVGLPRLTRDIDVEEFDRRAAAFYDSNPDERPPVPERGVRSPSPRGKTSRREPISDV